MKTTQQFGLKTPALTALLVCCLTYSYSQNSMTGDGFGGRSWYVPHNYQAGAYSAYTVCDSNNQLYAWGYNQLAGLGNGSNVSSAIPVAVIGMTNVKFYTTGYISAVIKNDSTAWAWGTGAAPYTYSSIAVQVLSDVKFADGGAGHIVFVKHDGTVWAAGHNFAGELGNDTSFYETVTVPVQMKGITNAVRAIAVGYYPQLDVAPASVILLADGSVKITGGYKWFTADSSTVPITLAGLPANIVDIKGNSQAAYALDVAGDVYSFGREMPFVGGLLGLGTGHDTVTSSTKITFPPGAAPIVALSANNDGVHALALDENKNVYGWGYNGEGAVGAGSTANVFTPVLVATNVIDIFAGETFSYILKADNSLWATGQSGRGSTWGSIWMNLPNIKRDTFTQINPLIAPMNLCRPKVYGVLPITLLNFNCKGYGNTALLNWQSGVEENADKYIIEYSSNGSNFISIASVKAKGSNNNYSYEHVHVYGTAFYRLKMTGKDGNYTYSEVRAVKMSRASTFTIAPNPAKGHININDISIGNIRSLQILSINGTLLKTINNVSRQQDIDIAALKAGVYILKATDSLGNVKYCRIIKQ